MPVTLDRGKAFRATLPLLGLLLALTGGIALRFAYPGDIEWKGDEQWTFAHAELMVASGAWPWSGMASSAGIPNPGLSLWIFAGLFSIFDVKTPPELARAVQSLNAAALVAFVLFAFAAIPKDRREVWLWAAALWAVNPLAILFERKIWPPSVLPLASVAFIASWYFRRGAGAAFAWGLLGALMAQVHMGAAFLAAALAGWTLVHDRAAFPWKIWLAGSVVGSLSALPWLYEVLSRGGNRSADWSCALNGGSSWVAAIRSLILCTFSRWLNLEYFWFFFTQPFGFNVEYTLGPAHMRNYLASPLLAGHPTYLIAIVHLVLGCLLVVTLVRAISMPRENGWLRESFFGSRPETLLVCVAIWGYGGVLTLLAAAGLPIQRHYLIVVEPIMSLCAVLVVMYGDRTPGRQLARSLLFVACVGQAILSAGLLHYIHRTAVIEAEYGRTWRSQQPGFVATGS